jgi:lactobin A/cerein 7B family class IIb bacteriocin
LLIVKFDLFMKSLLKREFPANNLEGNVIPLSDAEAMNIEGGIPPIVVAACIVGGAFVAGVVVGAVAAWAVYELTH